MRSERIDASSMARKSINIGYVGEQNHTCIAFSCHSLFEEHPDAVATLDIKPPVGEIYQATVEREQNYVVWYVSTDDVANAGIGQYQLTFMDGEEVIKQDIGTFSVNPSLVVNS